MGRLPYYRSLAAATIASLLAGCTDDTRRPGDPAADEVVRVNFTGRMLEIARDYEQYGRLDSAASWANALGLPIMQGPPTHYPRYSDSGDDSTHGRKMYWLFVKDRDAYAASVLRGRPSPVRQLSSLKRISTFDPLLCLSCSLSSFRVFRGEMLLGSRFSYGSVASAARTTTGRR